MDELVAWALGLVLGIVFARPLESALRAVAFAGVAVALGLGVTVLSGEWAESPLLALVDIGQVLLAASIGAFARPFLLRHLAPSRRSALGG